MAKQQQQQKQSFEQSMKRLEDIVQELENGEVQLENSLGLYEEGIALSESCMNQLSQAEIKLKHISKKMDGTFQIFDIDSSYEDDEE